MTRGMATAHRHSAAAKLQQAWRRKQLISRARDALTYARFCKMPAELTNTAYCSSKDVHRIAAILESTMSGITGPVVTPNFLYMYFYFLHLCPYSDYRSRMCIYFAVSIEPSVLQVLHAVRDGQRPPKMGSAFRYMIKHMFEVCEDWVDMYQEFHDFVFSGTLSCAEFQQHIRNTAMVCLSAHHRFCDSQDSRYMINYKWLSATAEKIDDIIEELVTVPIFIDKRRELSEAVKKVRYTYRKSDPARENLYDARNELDFCTTVLAGIRNLKRKFEADGI